VRSGPPSTARAEVGDSTVSICLSDCLSLFCLNRSVTLRRLDFFVSKVSETGVVAVLGLSTGVLGWVSAGTGPVGEPGWNDS